MPERSRPMPEFKSAVGPVIKGFVSEKTAIGYKFMEGARSLRCFDQFLLAKGLDRCALPEQLVREWTCQRNHESSTTHRSRFRLTRQLAIFMKNRGYDAYVPDLYLEPCAPGQPGFAPHIFTHEELRRIFKSLDEMKPAYNSRLRHLVWPELFRLLYGCGLRVGEVIRLTVADTDLQEGVITIRQTKFRKDRLVPLAPGLHARLLRFYETMGRRSPESPLFHRHGRAYTHRGVYLVFRAVLRRSGIPHRGRGQGPRVHDLRHTFAVHRLQEWYREGVDLTNRLPVLATYMGHRSFYCTQRYVHLTLELSAELSKRLEEKYGSIIPRRNDR